MNHCTYRLGTGEILRWTTHYETPPEGCACEQRAFDPRDGYINAAGEFAPMPERPSLDHTWNWPTHAWIDPRTPAQVLDGQWGKVRARRARVFAATVDRVNPLWLEELTDEQRAELATFRQDLKDITDQADPSAIVWPTPPAWLAVSIPG